jgi:predicted small secreted protein
VARLKAAGCKIMHQMPIAISSTRVSSMALASCNT